MNNLPPGLPATRESHDDDGGDERPEGRAPAERAAPVRAELDRLPVWLYWDDAEGQTRPAYLRLCERTIRLHAGDHPVRLTNLSDLRNWVSEPPPSLARLQPAHRADWARAHLLARHGGIWLDMDTIVLSPIDDLIDAMGDASSATYGDEGESYVATLLTVPDTETFHRWAEQQDALLAEQDPAGLTWPALGADLLDPILRDTAPFRLPRARLAPIAWRDWRIFLSRTYPATRVLDERPWQVALYNRFLRATYGDLDERSVLHSSRLVGRLLAVALGERSPDEVDGWLQRAEPMGTAWRRAGRRVRFENRRWRGRHQV